MGEPIRSLVTSGSNKSFINALVKQDNVAIAVHLSEFKERGMVNYTRVLAVPSAERIPALTQSKKDYQHILTILAVCLKSAFSNINLRIGLNESQIVELADQIINTSFEDNLSLEDVMLFLQEMVTGKAGKIYDRMDIPTFFELFETYRQKRYEALQEFRYEQSANHKALGPSERSSEDSTSEKDAHMEAMNEHLKHLYKDADK